MNEGKSIQLTLAALPATDGGHPNTLAQLISPETN